MDTIIRPNFMCIGATKSATTSLFDILKQHPMIQTSSFKEPHFFDNSINYKKGKDWYLKNYFSESKSQKVFGEFTPTYLSSKVVPERIFATFGEGMKFIIILRNPVDRAYSHFLHTIRDEHEKLDFIDALTVEKDRLVNFKKLNDDISFTRFSYIYQGLYSEHINHYLKYFSREQFHCILFDDFVNDRKETIKKILSFLEVDHNHELDLNIFSNKSSIARSKILKRLIKKDSLLKSIGRVLISSLVLRQKIRNLIHYFNNKETAKRPLLEDQRRHVYNTFFRDEIDKLEKMLNLNLNHWKEC